MDIGLGLNGAFDCSGLVIHALSRVLGRSIAAWPRHVRHTRQMWLDAQPGGLFAPASVTAGSLLVMHRLWTMEDGASQYMPAHIGIISGIAEDGTPIMVQAQAGEGDCAVVERPLRTMENILGAIQLSEVAIQAGRLVFAEEA